MNPFAILYRNLGLKSLCFLVIVIISLLRYPMGRDGNDLNKGVKLKVGFNEYVMNQTQRSLVKFFASDGQAIKGDRRNRPGVGGKDQKTDVSVKFEIVSQNSDQKSTQVDAEAGSRSDNHVVSSPTLKRLGMHGGESVPREKMQLKERELQQKELTLTKDMSSGFVSNTSKSRNENLSADKPTKKVDQNMTGLNAHIWFSVCPQNVVVLCNHPLFPLLPDLRTYVQRLEYERPDEDYAQRIFGYIWPPVTGKYRFGIASDDSSELWLSKDTDWRNSRLLCNVGSRVEPSWTSQNDWFNSFPSQVSNEVYLQQGHKYYIEIMHLQLGWGNFLRVAWKKPGITDFEVIDGNSTSLYQYEIHSESYVDYRRGMVHTGPACNATHPPKIRPHSFMKSQIHQYVLHESVKQTLPYCEYNASYTSLRAGGRDWEFISPPIRHDTYVFPYLEFSSDVVYIDKYPATPLPKEEAEGIVLEYMKKLKSAINPRKMKLLSILNVEKKLDEKKGKRYLVEVQLQLDGFKQPKVLSEYIFKHSSNGSLCYPSGLQWNRKANIGLIVTLKNQGKWMIHFLNNLEHIYLQTRDKFVTLVVFDYASIDIDIESALKDRKLPPYKLIRRPGVYSRTESFNAAVKLIDDPDTIIFALDLHLDLPTTLFDDIRKHCFKGVTVYTPIILRLKCGETSANPKGRWESHGFGMIGIYKSDWDRAGGLDVHKSVLWGGEDWELMERLVNNGLEYERIRNTNIFHYAHSRKGMWTGDPDIQWIPTE